MSSSEVDHARRRALAAAAVGCIGLSSTVTSVAVQPPFPTRPVRLIVALPAGGVTDVMARAIAAEMASSLGQPVIVGAYDASPWAKQGKVKVLASLAARRNTLSPQVPTVGELGFAGVAANSWAGLFVPPATPGTAVERLGRAALEAVRTPAVSERVSGSGLSLLGEEHPDAITAAIKAESQQWSKVIQRLGPANLN